MKHIAEINCEYKKIIGVLKEKMSMMEISEKKHVDNLIKILEDKIAENNEEFVNAYDYEDFLFEFSELVHSLKFISSMSANTDETDCLCAAPILRLLTTNFINCYNQFSKIGEILFSTSFIMIKNDDRN